jgi:hypothetical protein
VQKEYIFAKMKTLSTYIEYLIMTRRYAFVPGLGGFMVKETAARITTSVDELGVSHLQLVPPRQEVVFNRFITHDDGLLINTYMEFEGLSFNEAEARIKYEVGEMKAALDRRETVLLAGWGQLSTDEDCHWVFTATPTRDAALSNARQYGLETLQLKGWQKAATPLEAEVAMPSRKQPEPKAEHVVLPISRYVLQRVAVVVLIVMCCFCSFFLPSHQQGEQQRASVIDSEILTGTRLPNTLLHHSWEEIWDEEVARVEQEEEEASAMPLDTTEPTAEEVAVAEDYQPTAEKLFYIIVGSCGDTAEANRRTAQLEKVGYEAGVILKDDRYRICLSAFEDRATAEAFLTGIREVDIFHDAWLLPARQASVTYISKIKYNEQLPMELSHLTTGTQRNQGGDHS